MTSDPALARCVVFHQQATRITKQSAHPGAWSKMRVDLCGDVMNDAVADALERTSSGTAYTVGTAVGRPTHLQDHGQVH